MSSHPHIGLEKEKLYAPQDPKLRGQNQVPSTPYYVCTHIPVCKGIFQCNMYNTLQREAQGRDTGARITQDWIEKARRELHPPARKVYQVVSRYRVHLQGSYILTYYPKWRSQTQRFSRQYLKSHMKLGLDILQYHRTPSRGQKGLDSWSEILGSSWDLMLKSFW